MAILKQADNVIEKMNKGYQKHKTVINAAMCSICILLFAYYLIFLPFAATSGWLVDKAEIWYKIYTVINPFTTAAYVVGLVLLIQCTIYRNVLIKILMAMFYGAIMFISLVAIMGMTRFWELFIYLPHPILLGLCVFVTWRRSIIQARIYQ